MRVTRPADEGRLTAGADSASRESFLLSLAVFVLSLTFYCCIFARTVTRGGDCGELISDSWNLGIAHPSGYPLYLLVGRAIAGVLFWGNIAWRYAFYSSLFAALAAALVCATCYRLLLWQGYSKKTAGSSAAGAGLLLAGSYHFASQALIAEVYGMGGFLLASLLYTAVRWHLDEDWRWFLTLVLVTALALVTHLSCLFLLPGLYWFAVWYHRKRFINRGWFKWPWLPAAGLILASFCILAYFPLRSGLFPQPPRMYTLDESIYWPLDWGHPVELPDIRAHAQAKLYRSLLITPVPVTVAGQTFNVPTFTVPFSKWPKKMGHWLAMMVMGYLSASPIILIGAFAVWKQRGLAIALTITVFLNILEFGYKVSDLENFFFPIYISMAVWLAFGLAFMSGLGKKMSADWRWRYQTGGLLLLICTVGSQWGLFGLGAGWAHSTITHDAAVAQARAAADLERNFGRRAVVLMPNDDFLWGYWYAKFVEKEGGRSVTPWGRMFGQIVRQEKLAANVREWQKTGPVAVGYIHEQLANEFSFAPANSSGNLWLVRPLNEAVKAGPAAKAGSLAALKADPLWKSDNDGRPMVLRGGMATMEVTIPAEIIAKRKPISIEYLLAAPDHFDNTPPRNVTREESGEDFDRKLTVWSQQWPLHLPERVQPKTDYFAETPIQFDGDAEVGPYQVWARILTAGEGSAKWIKCGQLRLVVR